MMINKRLINTVADSKKHIAKNVFFRWCSLCCYIIVMFALGYFLNDLYLRKFTWTNFVLLILIIIAVLTIRFFLDKLASKESFLASKSVKKKLREMIFEKLLRLGGNYHQKISTAEIVQASVDGVNQLETYFGAYLPQFFYSMLAPITLFASLSFISLKVALTLLICVPLIPLSIMAVQTLAKKLLSKYWGQYTKLGDSFLENLQGLTTLKIYQSDEFKHQKMNEEAEHFRKVTMKVLIMQLNSIVVMDFIAYGGAALGIIFALSGFAQGILDFKDCFIVIMLAVEFFLPLRMLGSFFHVAMGGMAAADKIFEFLDLEEPEAALQKIDENITIQLSDLNYSYDQKRYVLKDINMLFPEKSFISIVGVSGCGKSTIAKILLAQNKNYSGSVKIGSQEIKEINKTDLLQNITLIGLASYIFKGTIRDNLLMGNPLATEEQMWQILKKVNLSSFFKKQNGLDFILQEKGSNLSGGQCQRLALARALLHDSKIYIFDEATSNIDVESENDILKLMHELAQTKTVILISHRLVNVMASDNIYVLENGNLKETGTHQQLLLKNKVYAQLWNEQKKLEEYAGVNYEA